KSEISELTVYFNISSSITLSLLQPLHTYIYYEDREIKIRDFSRYKRNILSEFHSFICILEQKFHLNL
ncbi:hypothetical protein BDDG_13595, partial [Blastomyces dermatitidis ATCC 18188]